MGIQVKNNLLEILFCYKLMLDYFGDHVEMLTNTDGRSRILIEKSFTKLSFILDKVRSVGYKLKIKLTNNDSVV